ncbi:hypothetical protein AKJ47_02420 [candidate division MSBL1 archaeon SCGC-AAA261G05]|uniref:Pyrroline-5-carboxylate reductase catalytic N-terminal domain-containing protein n=2 Tax=candidate division MSBL1 TaxID=215777 RepID=A0A133VA94_9EURY|nr:hypothetical protein AKJ47_02420 [candidate division MSBL1 archaeon SCGC-AAA261G05]KXB04448.1 hypothetical protein AKJ48_02565 [candidate division MSBL1 archaeon SCGC-AAA261O19]
MIAVIGGTGKLGQGLVARLAMAGEEVIIGSRTPKKAERVAKELSEKIGEKIKGTGNEEAARQAELVILSIPFKGMEKILNQIKPALNPDKIVVSVIVPFSFEEGWAVLSQSKSGSAAEEVASRTPKNVPVISTFQTASANRMRDLGEPLSADVPVCGDDEDAKNQVIELVEKLPGARAIDAGPLANSALTEAVGVLLIDLTRRHGVKRIGLKFEGV